MLGTRRVVVLAAVALVLAALTPAAAIAGDKPIPKSLGAVVDAASHEIDAQQALAAVAYPYLGWRNNGGPWFNEVLVWLAENLDDYGFTNGQGSSGDRYWFQEDSRSGNVWVPQYASFEIVGPDGDAAPGDPDAYHFDHPAINTFDPTSKYYPAGIGLQWVLDNIGTPEERALNDRVHLATSSGFTSPIDTDLAVAETQAIIADVVDVGTITRSGSAYLWSKNTGVDLAGKIIFTTTSSRSFAYALARQEGARVSMSTQIEPYNNPVIDGEELFPNTVKYAGVSNSGGSNAVVALNISPQDGRYLTELTEAADAAGETVQMKAMAIGGFVPYSETTKLRTLIAEIPGTTKPDERIVFLAHAQEPGACDNASGVGAQLEIVRTLKALIDSGRLQRPQRTLTFIWGAEITMGGLWKGQNPAAFANTKAALVLDMVGEDPAKTGGIMRIEKMPDPSAVYGYGLDTLPGEVPPTPTEFIRQPDTHTLWGAGDLRFWPFPGHFLNDLYFASARAVTDEVSPTFQVGENPWEGGSDHDTFLWNRDAGVYNPKPAALTWHFTDYVYHSSMDTMEMVSAQELRDVGLTTIGVGYLIANADAVRGKEIMRIVVERAAWRFGWEEQNSAGHLQWARDEAVAAGGTPQEVAAAVAEALVLEEEILNAWGTWYKEAVASPGQLVTLTRSYENVEAENVEAVDALLQHALANAEAIAASLTPPAAMGLR